MNLHPIKRLWRRLINTGITDDLSASRRGVIRTVNVTSLVASITSWLFILYDATLDLFLAGTDAIAGLLLPLPIFFNHRQQHQTATLLLFLTLHVFTGLVTFVLVPGQMLEFIHVALIVSLLMVYGWTWPFFAFYVLNVLMFYGPQLLLQVYPDTVFSFYYPLVTLVPIVFVVKHFLGERDAYERRLAAQNEKLLRLNEEKDQLVSIAAHDLKSPLNRIEGLLSIVKLSSDNLTAEQHELIDKVSEVSKEQNALIRDILNIDALENNAHEKLSLQRINVTKVIAEVLEDFTLVANNKSIDLQTDYDTHVAYVQGDHTALIQVYENLLSNALKFSPPGKKVRITLRLEEDMVRTAVQDEGPGLQPEDVPLLFRKFQKLSAQPTAGESSSGLGLSIVKRYVDAMDGQIHYEATPGQGATFVVRFKQAVDRS